MPRAIPIRREKVIDEQGNIVELAIWKVLPSRENATGIRYRLAWCGEARESRPSCTIATRPRGITGTWRGSRSRTAFVDVDQLLTDFTSDVRRVTGDATWPRR
jgi:hypothetical protein